MRFKEKNVKRRMEKQGIPSLLALARRTNLAYRTLWGAFHTHKFNHTTLTKLCSPQGLNCQPGHILEYVPEDEVKATAA